MTITPWLTKAGRFPVEHIGGIPHLNEGVDLFSPRTGIIHTTEPGPRASQLEGWDAAIGVFKHHWSPHFLIGAGRIAQLVQVGTRSGALVDHNVSAIVQVEVVANSSESPWLFDDATAEAVAALMAACHIEYGIPLFRPWPDGVYGKARASDPHRAEGKYGHVSGWFGHGDIPSPDCVTPETPILCSDLSWRMAGDLKAGDEIVGFSEHQDIAEGIFDNRRISRAVVEANRIAPKACVVVKTDCGEMVASTDHPFLTRIPYLRNWSNQGRSGTRWRWGWKTASELAAGDEVAFLHEPWAAERDYDAGWLAGFFDGEGCLSVKAQKTFAVSASQVIGPTCDRLMALLERYGIPYTPTFRHLENPAHKDARQITLKGGRIGAMKFLGRIRPERLLARSGVIWEDALVSRAVRKAKVIDVSDAGMRDVASLQTSSRTYVANGFMVHNSHWDPGNLKWSALFARAAEIEHDPSPAPAPIARICPAGTDHATDVGSVEWAQARLNTLGFARPRLDVDGDIGVMTKNAIAHFQAAHGLFVDGALGPETIKALGG